MQRKASTLHLIGEICGPMRLNPEQLAVRYYYDDLTVLKLPRIAVDALEEGYDGPALRS